MLPHLCQRELIEICVVSASQGFLDRLSCLLDWLSVADSNSLTVSHAEHTYTTAIKYG